MRSIEATGKTVKDAVENGLARLGCDRDDVEIQVIQINSTGLFGMFAKPARVLLTVKDADPALDIQMPVLNLDGGARKPKADKRKADKPKNDKPQEAAKPAPAAEPAAAEAAGEAAEEAAPKPEKKSRRRRRRGKGEAAAQNPAGAPRDDAEPIEGADEAEIPAPMALFEREPFEPTPDEALSESAKKAQAFLLGLTERMGVPISLEIQETEEQLRMQMSGESMSLLIGRRGETLDALQYLTSLTINRGREEYLRVSIDTENYRAKREEALRKLAVRMAGRAKKSGRRVALEPMNPYERRILHSALQSDPDVTTHSEGEEPYRRVIISLK